MQVFTNPTKPITDRQALTVDNTSGGVTLTVPSAAIAGVARLETAQIRWTTDGTAPTTTVGTLLEIGETIEFDTRKEMTGFKAIRTGGSSGTLQVEYFGMDT